MHVSAEMEHISHENSDKKNGINAGAVIWNAERAAIFHGIRDWKAFPSTERKATGKTGKIEAPEAEKKRYFEARDHAVKNCTRSMRKPLREVGEGCMRRFLKCMRYVGGR